MATGSSPVTATLRVVLAALLVTLAVASVGCAGESASRAGGCDPSYKGGCLDPTASDYDCAGGSGDGPRYTGRVEVVGSDPFGLDADGDGVGCQ
jgi:hypothetical protein